MKKNKKPRKRDHKGPVGKAEVENRKPPNTSEKEVYTRAVVCYNEVIRDILAAPPIDHVRLEHFQYRRQNKEARLQELTDRANRIVVELLQLRR